MASRCRFAGRYCGTRLYSVGQSAGFAEMLSRFVSVSSEYTCLSLCWLVEFEVKAIVVDAFTGNVVVLVDVIGDSYLIRYLKVEIKSDTMYRKHDFRYVSDLGCIQIRTPATAEAEASLPPPAPHSPIRQIDREAKVHSSLAT